MCDAVATVVAASMRQTDLAVLDQWKCWFCCNMFVVLLLDSLLSLLLVVVELDRKLYRRLG